MKRLFSLILTILLSMSFTIGMVACGQEEDETTTTNTRYNNMKVPDDVTHIRNADVIEDKYIVKDGVCNYILVTPTNKKSDSYYTISKEEFSLFFRRSTNITIGSSYDVIDNEDGTTTSLEHNATNKYISLGDTTLLDTSGITPEQFDRESLHGNGCRIITVDDTIYILGQNGKGVLNGVYTFFELVVNYDYISRGCEIYDKNVANMQLRKFDVKEIPDQDYRVGTNQTLGRPSRHKTSKATTSELAAGYTNWDWERYQDRRRARSYQRDYNLCIFQHFCWDHQAYSTDFHNTSEYFNPKENDASEAFDPKVKELLTNMPDRLFPGCTTEEQKIEKLQEYMAKWSGTSFVQWCFNARGDELALEAMAYWSAMKIEHSLIVYPVTNPTYADYNTATLSIEDGAALCDCEACVTAVAEDCGSYQGAPIRLLNRVMEIVNEWQDRPENEKYKRDLKLIYFAYSTMVPPPAIENEETGELELVDEDCRPDDDVGVWFATSSNYYTTHYDDRFTNNNQYAQILNFYGKYYKTVWIWTYTVNYFDQATLADHFSWYNNDTYSFLMANNVQLQFSQGTFGEWEFNFGWLREYLNAKLNWNCTLNSNELTQKFFDAMYGPASKTMREAFEYYRSTMQAINAYANANKLDKASRLKCWTYTGFWKPYYAYFLKAYEQVESIQDPAQRTLYKERVEDEMVMPLYHIVSYHSDFATMQFDLETRKYYIETVKRILERMPYLYLTEKGLWQQEIA